MMAVVAAKRAERERREEREVKTFEWPTERMNKNYMQ
jgi:hypothetical protein